MPALCQLRSANRPLLTVILVLAVAWTVLSSVVAPQRADAVAHGAPAPPGAFLFAAKFTFTGIPRTDGTTYDSACSGALVAPQWVITAGHCFHDAARTPVSGPPVYGSSTVTVGRTRDAGPGGETRSVVDVRQAPAGADVALARLSAPVTGVRPLAVTSAAPHVGELLVLAGWGATSEVDPVPSTRLLTGLMSISTVDQQTLGVVGRAPAPDTSACTYDSGAPYFRWSHGQLVLVSVESTGPPCPHTTAETTYRTDVLATWIHQVVGQAS